MRKLTDEIREKLKRPFGELVGDKVALERAGKRKGRLVSIGDECSCFFLKSGIRPDVMIYDFKIKRQPVGDEMRQALEGADGKLVRVVNEAGTISDALVSAVKRALEGKADRIFVDGEEDLAALVALMFADDGVMVTYGQPDEGIVLTVSSEETRNRARRLYAKMLEV